MKAILYTNFESKSTFRILRQSMMETLLEKKTVPLLVITEDINDQEVAENYRTVDPGRLGEDLNDSD